MRKRQRSWQLRCFMVSWVLYCLARQELAKGEDQVAIQEQEHAEHRRHLSSSAFNKWAVASLRTSCWRSSNTVCLWKYWRQWTCQCLLKVRTENLRLLQQNQSPLFLCGVTGAVDTVMLVVFFKWRAIASKTLCVDLASRVSVLIQTVAHLSTEHVESSQKQRDVLPQHAYI